MANVCKPASSLIGHEEAQAFAEEDSIKKHLQPLTPAALYARVSSDRQDVDLSVSAQLRALRDYAERNGYLVAREYVDEAESGRIADRPQFRKMLDEAAKPEAPFKEILIRQTQ